MRFQSASELAAYRQKLQADIDPNRIAVRICMTGCRAYGAEQSTGLRHRALGNFLQRSQSQSDSRRG